MASPSPAVIPLIPRAMLQAPAVAAITPQPSLRQRGLDQASASSARIAPSTSGTDVRKLESSSVISCQPACASSARSHSVAAATRIRIERIVCPFLHRSLSCRRSQRAAPDGIGQPGISQCGWPYHLKSNNETMQTA
jgi:hypothetical protein